MPSVYGSVYGAAGTFPDEGDVREDVVYGPTDNLIGYLAAPGVPDFSGGNLSQFETGEYGALDSYYVVHGIDAEYYTKADDDSKWLVVVLLGRTESLEYEGEIQSERELIVVLMRRYSGVDHLAVDRPAKGDRLSVPSLDGTRKYTLTETPVVSSGQLEWKAEFSRSKQVKGGGRNVVRNGS